MPGAVKFQDGFRAKGSYFAIFAAFFNFHYKLPLKILLNQYLLPQHDPWRETSPLNYVKINHGTRCHLLPCLTVHKSSYQRPHCGLILALICTGFLAHPPFLIIGHIAPINEFFIASSISLKSYSLLRNVPASSPTPSNYRFHSFLASQLLHCFTFHTHTLLGFYGLSAEKDTTK